MNVHSSICQLHNAMHAKNGLKFLSRFFTEEDLPMLFLPLRDDQWVIVNEENHWKCISPSPAKTATARNVAVPKSR